jgi:acyl-CoA thioesterase I
MRACLSGKRLLGKILLACLLILPLGAIGQAQAKQVRVVAIGADNVKGMGMGKKRSGGVLESDAFPAQLQALLRARGIDAEVINAGVAGDTTRRMLDELDSSVPEGTRIVIVDRANGNDKTEATKDKQGNYLEQIKARLAARHIAVILLPKWRKIPGLLDERDSDGHHFTAKGHAIIASYLLPQVMEILGEK